MDKSELTQLKELAEKATPGPWEAYFCNYIGYAKKGYRIKRNSEYNGSEKWIPYLCDVCKMEINRRAHPLRKPSKQEILEANADTAAYIAAANPQAILALLDEIERLEKEADWLADIIVQSESNMCYLRDCPQKAPESPTREESEAFYDNCVKCWRDAARKAVS